MSRKTSPYFKTKTPDIITTATIAVKRKTPPPSKLTPFELEILELKLKHPKELVLVEFGYNHKFYCEDGKIASKVLGYKFSAGRKSFYQEEKKLQKTNSGVSKQQTQRFAFCSLNSKSLNECLVKLVSKNHKILLYKQSTNAQTGEVTRFIEKAMSLTTFNYINETISDVVYSNNQVLTIENSTILSVYFTYSNAILKSINFLGLDLKSCKVTHDCLINEENYDESHLKTGFLDIIAKFETIEIVVNGEAPDKLMKYLSGLNKNIKIYKQDLVTDDDQPKEFQLLYGYLKDYNLENTLKASYSSIQSNNNTKCALSNNIIKHLNFFENQVTNHTTSTFGGLLNNKNILTNYGRDMLIQWIRNPLTVIEEIKLRNEAMTFLGKQRHIPILLNALKKFFENPNFRKISRIASKIKLNPKSFIDRKDIYFYLSALNTLRDCFLAHQEFISQLRKGENDQSRRIPLLLINLFIECDDLLREMTIHTMLSFIDKESVFSKDLKTTITTFLKLTTYDNSENITKIEKELSLIEEKKNQQLDEFKRSTGKPYLAFHEDGFNIIIRTTEARGLPADWVFVESTYKKTTFRRNIYKTPETAILNDEYEAKQTELLQVCNAEYKLFVDRLNTDYDIVSRIIEILGSIDCLRCIGLSTRHFPTTPMFTTEPGVIQLKDAHNPMLDFSKENLASWHSSQNIPNNISLHSDKLFILTGPNAGGKTTIMKKIAYLCIMAQIGCNTPCKLHKQSIFTSFDIRTGSSDSTVMGKSTFLNEMLEYKTMADNMSERSLVLLDEIGRGTSHKDGASLTYAFLKDLKERGREKGIVMFITHYHDILHDQEDFEGKEIYKMGFHTVNNENMKVSIPTFKLEQGIGKSLGVELAKVCGFDDDVVDSIESYREILETRQLIQKVDGFVKTQSINILKRLLDDI